MNAVRNKVCRMNDREEGTGKDRVRDADGEWEIGEGDGFRMFGGNEEGEGSEKEVSIALEAKD